MTKLIDHKFTIDIEFSNEDYIRPRAMMDRINRMILDEVRNTYEVNDTLKVSWIELSNNCGDQKCVLCGANENENGYNVTIKNKEQYLCWDCHDKIESGEIESV